MPRTDPAHPRPSLRATLNALHVDAALRTMYENVCSSSTMIVVAMALALGLPAEQCGWTVVLYSSTGILLAVGAVGAGRFAHPKRTALMLAVIEPALMVVIGLSMPWLPAKWALGIAAVALVLAGATMHLNQPIKDEWLASAVPSSLRGHYLARRFQIIAIMLVLTMIVLGYVGTWAGITEDSSNLADPLRLGLIIAIAGCIGILEIIPLARAAMPALSAQTRVEWRDFIGVMRNPTFVRFYVMLFIFNTPFVLSSPYCQVVYQDVLHASAAQIAGLLVVAYLAKLVTLRFVGRMLAHVPAGRAILYVSPFYVIQFVTMAFTQPHSLWPLYIGCALAGAAEAVWVVATNVTLFKLIPQDRTRAAYFACWRISLLVQVTIGGALAVGFVRLLRGVTIDIGPIHLSQFQIYFVLCALLTIPCMFSALIIDRRGPPQEAGE